MTIGQGYIYNKRHCSDCIASAKETLKKFQRALRSGKRMTATEQAGWRAKLTEAQCTIDDAKEFLRALRTSD